MVRTFDGSRPLMDLSALVVLPDAVNDPSIGQSLKLLTLQTPGAGVQQVPMPNASNILLQGLTAQQLNEWLDSLNTPRNASRGEEQIDRVRLATEVTELAEGSMGVNRFVEGLRPEVGQMIKSHLICWQAKPIDELLQYAKYCSDEIELKQKKLKEKAMMMQIKAAQTGVKGALVQQIPQQQGTVMFQPQMRESDRGTHFNNEAIKLLHAALYIEQKLHCSYRPEASGLVEQMNGTLKSRIAKMCAATNLKWPDALPLVLMLMRNTPDRKTGLSPHEILMGRAMRLSAVLANALVNITDDMVLYYYKGLDDVVCSFSQQVQATTLPPIHDPGHNLRAGDWIIVRKHVCKTCLEPHWGGPSLVILKTMTAVKCAGLPNWIHASHTKRVVCPQNYEETLLKAPNTVKQVAVPEPEK
ncbi:hypothetical protein NDU88_004582 [Pleurodeles waltl]|uniref:Integrase catalytic domain-containing protein n=1 Tax=Pleurodeles waltl TaxID=8319 RepID=A0AAV7RLS6_PLEWA|nr:hypothetical protein NDU88_004582 [Pleurodeles waltl]